MKKIDAIKDILQNRISNEIIYNENLIKNTNPELRQVFSQLRDDEMRSIVKLQKNVERLETPTGAISKIFTSKSKY
jgi:rubrerythrin